MADEVELKLLRRIDAKLGALLVVNLEEFLRRHPEVAKPRPRTLDQMLADAGLAARDIASLLGKSEQAVYLQLSKKAKKTGRSSSESAGADQGTELEGSDVK